MKLPRLLTLAACVLGTGLASATVTLQFSNIASGAITNIADSTGNAGAELYWGILVDAAGDGFDFSTSNNQQFPLASYPSGVVVPGSNDDVLFMDLNVRTVTSPGPQGGAGTISSLAGILLNSALGVNSGDAFQIIWFDSDVGSATLMEFGDYYGTLAHAGFVLPPDGFNQPYGDAFAGPDPVRPATIPWIFPEPSSLMLSLLGVLPLLRRRR